MTIIEKKTLQIIPYAFRGIQGKSYQIQSYVFWGPYKRTMTIIGNFKGTIHTLDYIYTKMHTIIQELITKSGYSLDMTLDEFLQFNIKNGKNYMVKSELI